MERPLESCTVASILLESPIWARLGLTVRDERMRERAADVIGAIIVARLAGDQVEPDRNQLTLGLHSYLPSLNEEVEPDRNQLTLGL